MGGGTKRGGGVVDEPEDKSSKRRKICNVAKEDVLPLAVFSHLPARDAARGVVLSKRWREILTGGDFWANHYQRPSKEVCLAYLDRGHRLPFKFSLYGLEGKHAFYLVAAGDTFPISHGLPVAGTELSYRFFGSCNGLVAFEQRGLSDSSMTCLVANPATSQHLTAQLLDLGTFSWMLAFGYDPKEDKYKVFVQCGSDVHVVPLTLSGTDGSRPVTVLPNVAHDLDKLQNNTYSLCIEGNCYVLLSPRDDGTGSQSSKEKLLVFHVQSELVTSIDTPEDGTLFSGIMEMGKSVCVATLSRDRPEITLSVLNSGLLWERMCCLSVSPSPGGRGPGLLGAWQCKQRLVLWFREHGLAFYNLSPANLVDAVHGCTQTCSLEGYQEENHKLLQHLHKRYHFCWGYRPTLVAPGSVIGKVCVTKAEDNILASITSGRIVPEEPHMELLQAVASAVLSFLG
ncbi:hypothetical protein TRIUR3_19899 [Triticum urartu]|uniref:F-box associated beta-propeller type 3 domain-containing protein n=2 Tax=Triticum TaxID=4564 RepID=M8AB04_TRIUA|nr:putative F-box protein At4g21240 [Triticum dicoccoides]XP_048528354.1 putative F-box protein At4g21240 [Triticum urartu]EMS61890.1 hypothetical protein TRIUR3_19899 [Triticum urartu]VAI13168.1 unnamed protein product [Triticum turgidum subsp. durum]